MSTATSVSPNASAIMAQLTELADPKILAVNERHGDDHAVNLTKLRGVAKAAGRDLELARELWATGDTAARLVAILMTRPKDFSAAELDAMLRAAVRPKVHDWLVNYLAKKSPHADELRQLWFSDPDPVVASAGWALTSDRIEKKPAGIDQEALLDVIEADMREAPQRLQWAMNQCLATIGIETEQLRARALDIGERLEVLKDYPTPPGCTSPFAPSWINEIVSRRTQAG